MRPTSPGATGRLSSSNTIVSGPIFTLISPLLLAVAPFSSRRSPLKPLSEDPTASLMYALGSSSRNSSFITGENTAAVELTEYTDETS